MPAERAILAPPPGRSSMAWTTVPTGMLRSGRLLPGLMSALGPVSTRVALAQPRRRDDVALLAVGVVQQRDPRGAVGVVLDVRDLGRHAVLVVATEVDEAVGALVAAALVPGGDPAVVVAAALAVQRPDQRLLRRGPGDLDEVGHAGAAAARGRRLVLADSPCLSSLSSCRCSVPSGAGPPKMSIACSPATGSRSRAWCPCACRSRAGALALALAG